MNLTRRSALILVATADFSKIADAQQAQAPPADPEAMARELRSALNGLVLYEVARRGAALANDGVKQVDSIVGDGVQKMQSKKEINDIYLVSIAIDGARRLGAEIVNDARNARENLKQIGAKSVQATRDHLCPLYPFC